MDESIIYHQMTMLKNFFEREIIADYVYLDFPTHQNVGDWLIAMGAWRLLNDLPYSCIKRASIVGFNYEWQSIPQNAVILLHGGGNFGDLYPGATWFRNEVVKHCPNNKIIFLPQTITYKNIKNIIETVSVCSLHKNLILCARDQSSYELLKQHFTNNRCVLLPDTAWGLYDYLGKFRKPLSSRRSLVIKRNDEEFEKGFDIDDAVDVVDWQDILRIIHLPFMYMPYRIIRKLSKIKIIPASIEKRICDLYMINVLYSYVLKNVVGYIQNYKKIYSTRLHGWILASMLQIECEWTDTKYKKISNYFNTWIIEKANG